jgi:hypothetical protein
VRSIKDLLNISTRERNRGTLWAAVQARRVIELYYHGGYVTVEPFALGIFMGGDGDNESLICYQTSNSRDINDQEGWRLYRTPDIKGIKVSTEQFTGDRPGYNPDDIDMVKVFCCVRPQKPAAGKVIKTRPPPEVKPPPVYTAPRLSAPGPLTHNELMRRFRLAHPAPVPALSANPFSGSPVKPLPERPESKIKPTAHLIK